MRPGSGRKMTWEAEKSVSDARKPERAWTAFFFEKLYELQPLLMNHGGTQNSTFPSHLVIYQHRLSETEFLLLKMMFRETQAKQLTSSVPLGEPSDVTEQHPFQHFIITDTYTHSPGLEQFPFLSLQPSRQIAKAKNKQTRQRKRQQR